MNFIGLVDRLSREAGTPTGTTGSGPSSALAQTGENQRLADWINDSWLDIQSKHPDWDWARTTTTFGTNTGQAKYTTAQANTTNFGSWARDTFRNYLNPTVTVTIASPGVVTLTGHGLIGNDPIAFWSTGALPTGIVQGTNYYVLTVVDVNTFTIAATVGGAAINTSGTQSGIHNMSSQNLNLYAGYKSEARMTYVDYDLWRDSYQYGALRFTQTRPIDFSIGPLKEICVGPFPVLGYTIVGDYFKTPTYLTTDAAVPALPTQFHMAIVWGALAMYCEHEHDDAVAAYANRRYKKLMARLESDQLAEMLIGGALA